MAIDEKRIERAREWLEVNTPIRWTTKRHTMCPDVSVETLNRRPQQWAERLAAFAQSELDRANRWNVIATDGLPEHGGDFDVTVYSPHMNMRTQISEFYPASDSWQIETDKKELSVKVIAYRERPEPYFPEAE